MIEHNVMQQFLSGGWLDPADLAFVVHVLEHPDEARSENQIIRINKIMRAAQMRRQDYDEANLRPRLSVAEIIARYEEDQRVNVAFAHRLLDLLDPADDETRIEILVAMFSAFAFDGANVERALMMARVATSDGEHDGGQWAALPRMCQNLGIDTFHQTRFA